MSNMKNISILFHSVLNYEKAYFMNCNAFKPKLYNNYFKFTKNSRLNGLVQLT